MKTRNQASVSQTVRIRNFIGKGPVNITQNATACGFVSNSMSRQEIEEQIKGLVADLDEYRYSHEDILQAQIELLAAIKELQRRRPRERKMREVLAHARDLLEQAVSIGVPIVGLLEVVTQLAEKVSRIFGR